MLDIFLLPKMKKLTHYPVCFGLTLETTGTPPTGSPLQVLSPPHNNYPEFAM